MKKMSKLFVLGMLLALTLSACGKKTNNADEVAPTQTPAAEDNASGNTTENPDNLTEGETPNDMIGVPEDDTEDNTEDLPGMEEASELSSNDVLDEYYGKVKELIGENYIPNAPYDAITMEELFGIAPDWYDAAIAEGPMMSVHVDKFIVLHATEGNLEKVRTALEDYQNTLIEETMNYPMNLNRIQGSVVDTVGEYAIFAMVGAIDEMQYTEEEDMVNAYKDENKKVVDLAKGILDK